LREYLAYQIDKLRDKMGINGEGEFRGELVGLGLEEKRFNLEEGVEEREMGGGAVGGAMGMGMKGGNEEGR
jgi:hypothetical protein